MPCTLWVIIRIGFWDKGEDSIADYCSTILITVPGHRTIQVNAGQPFCRHQRIEKLHRPCSDHPVGVEPSYVYATSGIGVEHRIIQTIRLRGGLTADVTAKI